MKIIRKSSALFFLVTLCMAGTVSVGTIAKLSETGTFRPSLFGTDPHRHANGFGIDAGIADGVAGLEKWTRGVSSDLVLRIYDSIADDWAPMADASDFLASNFRVPPGVTADQYQNTLVYIDGRGSLAAGNMQWLAAAAGLGGGGLYTFGNYTYNGHGGTGGSGGNNTSGGQTSGGDNSGAPVQNKAGTPSDGASNPPGLPNTPHLPGDRFDDSGSPEDIVNPPIPKGNNGGKADGNHVPEPGSIALLGLGLFGLAAARRRSSK